MNAYIKESHCCSFFTCYTENLLNFSIPLSQVNMNKIYTDA